MRRLHFTLLLLLIAPAASAWTAEPLTGLMNGAKELDLDGDGKVDSWREFNAAGDLVEARYDLGADGKPDEWVKREGRKLIRTRATGEDGKVNWRETTSYDADDQVLKVETEQKAGESWVLIRRQTPNPANDRLKVEEFTAGGKVSVTTDDLRFFDPVPPEAAPSPFDEDE